MKTKLAHTLLILLCISSSFRVSSQNATALSFDGVNDYIMLPQQISGDFTIEYWIKTTQSNGATAQWYNGNGIIDSEVGGVTNDFGTSIVGTKMAFGMGNPDITIFSTSNINTGTWMHVSATWKRSTGAMSLYINGVLEATGTSGTALRTSGGIAFGRMYTGVSYFNGEIDELRIWNVERTPSELAANYSCELNPGLLDPALKVRYTFNQGIVGANNSTVTTLFDQSGNTVDVTLMNFALTGTVSNWVGSTVVNVTPTLSVNSGTICSGESFTMIPSGAATYTFSSGSDIVAPTTNTFYTIAGTSTAGCVNTMTITSNVTVHSSPTVAVTSGSICAGATFTMVPTGAISYTFDNGSASVSPNSTTSYSVTGSNSDGCLSTAVSIITVQALPFITATSGSICSGQSFSITLGGADSYTIDGGLLNVSPATNTTYAVTGSSLGCISSNTALATITVAALPVISATSGSICAGTNFTIGLSGGDSYTVSGGSSTVSPATNTSYAVTGSLLGCSATNTATASVTVVPLPFVSASSGSICAGKSFTMALSGASSYTVSGGTSTVSPATNTTYAVTGSSLGCVSSNTAISMITVIALPLVSATSGSICAGKSFTINLSGGDSYTVSGGTSTVSPATNTTYAITGSSLGCVSSNTATSTITVVALPLVSVTSGSICAGKSFTMALGGASTYTISGGTATVSPATNTTYAVTGSSLGCVSSNTATSTVTVMALPLVTVTSGSICAGNIFTMVPGGASTYTFSNGSSTVNPIVNTSYSLSGTSSAGCISSNTAVATITVAVLPTLSISTTPTICNTATASLSVSGASTYTWNTSATTTIITSAPSLNTTYSVTGTAANGCTNSISQLITVNPLPTITVNSGAICPGNSFVLIPAGADTYTFSNGSATVTPASNTSYTVTGSSLFGCVSATEAVATVSVVNTLTVTISGPGAICHGLSLNLTAGGASSYTWNTGVTTSSILLAPAVNTTYTVLGSSGTCSNSAIITITVNALPVIQVNSGSICNGATFTIQPTGANTYTYSGGSTNVSPISTTSYSVNGTDLNGCISAIPAVSSVTVNDLPVISLISSASVICAGEQAILTSGGASTYTWNNGATTTTLSVTPGITTDYSVTGMDANGCSNTANITQTVSMCAGIRSLASNEISYLLYPNPSPGEFIIETLKGSYVTIFNTLGEKVMEQKLTEEKNTIQLNSVSKGIYFVNISQNGQTKTIRILKN